MFAKSQKAVENRGKWRNLVAKSSVVPQRPSRLRDIIIMIVIIIIIIIIIIIMMMMMMMMINIIIIMNSPAVVVNGYSFDITACLVLLEKG